MKNAMKKLMSLVLVAVLLVSAVPFQASADTTGAVTVVIVDNANDGEAARFDKTPSYGAAKAIDLLNYWAKNSSDVESVEFLNAYAYYADGSKGEIEADGTVAGGDKIRIRANITWKQAEPEQKPEEKPEEKPTEAPEATVAPIKIVVKVASSDNVVWTGEKVPANGEYALAENLLTYCWNSSWENVYTVDHAWSSMQQANVANDAKIYAGDTLSVMLKEKNAGTGSNSGSSNNGNVVDEEWMKDIYLYIYTNNDIVAPAKRVLLNNYLVIKDNTLSKTEILSVVDDYYKATNSNNGIIWKGAYMENGNIDAINFVEGRNEVPFEQLDVARSGASAVVIKVRVTGVTATSSSTADSSNPKTGDMIFAPIAVMTVSASALALFFFFNKKRAI